MNRVLIISIFCVFMNCKDDKSSGKSLTNNISSKTDTIAHIYDSVNTLSINTDESIVKWKGTKLMHTGKHEGTVAFKSGKMMFSNGDILSGKFVVDMTSIYNTDMPLSDPVPRKNITTHLNKDFETSIFPIATFVITDVKESDPGAYLVTGDMVIKGISRPITITMKEIKHEKEYNSTFTFNRFLWKIGEKGSWLEKKLVDEDITLQVKVVL